MSLTDPTKKISKSDPNLLVIYCACGGKKKLDFNSASFAKETIAEQIIKELSK